MKTPEEIRKGLKCCAEFKSPEICDFCTYSEICAEEYANHILPGSTLMRDALAYINQLEDQFRDATEKVSPAEPAPKWISVEERLPDKSMDWVLVAMQFAESGRGYAVPNIAELRNGKWRLMDNEYSLEQLGLVVSHWMPLPEPPKEEPK